MLMSFSTSVASAAAISSARVVVSDSARPLLKSTDTRRSAHRGRLLMAEMASYMVEEFLGAM